MQDVDSGLSDTLVKAGDQSTNGSVRPLRHSNDLLLDVPFTRDHSLFNRCFIRDHLKDLWFYLLCTKTLE